jgi:hypothetical protein
MKQRFQALNSSAMSIVSRIRYICRCTNLLIFVLLRSPPTLAAHAFVRHKNSFWKTVFCQWSQHVQNSCSLKSRTWRKAPTHSKPDARRRGWLGPQLLYTWKRPCTDCTTGRESFGVGLDSIEHLTPTGIRSPDCPVRCKSLYRLSYPGNPYLIIIPKIYTTSLLYLQVWILQAVGQVLTGWLVRSFPGGGR